MQAGITKLAYVMGRNTFNREEEFELNVRHVETRSFWLDLKILGLTLGTVASRKGISTRREATVPAFKACSKIRDP